MSSANQDEFMPTIMFGFMLKDGKNILHQMWVTPMGLTEWRQVPMLELSSERKPAVAGYLEENDEDR